MSMGRWNYLYLCWQLGFKDYIVRYFGIWDGYGLMGSLHWTEYFVSMGEAGTTLEAIIDII